MGERGRERWRKGERSERERTRGREMEDRGREGRRGEAEERRKKNSKIKSGVERGGERERWREKRRKAEGERDKEGEERRMNGRIERGWRGEWDALPERPTCAPPPGSLQAAAHKAAFDALATRAILGMRWGEKAPTHTP